MAEIITQSWPNGRGASYGTQDEYAALLGTPRYRTPSILHPGAPLWHIRGEIEALRGMLDKPAFHFDRDSVGECLDHILRQLDDRALQWDVDTGAVVAVRRCKDANITSGCDGWLDANGGHVPAPSTECPTCLTPHVDGMCPAERELAELESMRAAVTAYEAARDAAETRYCAAIRAAVLS